jgi:chromosome segregation ATPase
VDTREAEQLREKLNELHDMLNVKYHHLFDTAGEVQEAAQRLRRALPSYYEEVQSVLVSCENLASEVYGQVAEADDNGMDVESIRALVDALEQQASETENELNQLQSQISDLSDLIPSE